MKSVSIVGALYNGALLNNALLHKHVTLFNAPIHIIAKASEFVSAHSWQIQWAIRNLKRSLNRDYFRFRRTRRYH